MNDMESDPGDPAAFQVGKDSFRRTRLILPYLLFQVVSRLSGSLLEHARGKGMTVARFRVLAQLVDTDGIRIRDLVRECAVEQSAMSRVVDQLERDGLVTRRLGGEDNRAVRVCLTEKGRDTYEELFPQALAVVSRSTSDLSDAETRQLISLLQRMLGSVDPDFARRNLS